MLPIACNMLHAHHIYRCLGTTRWRIAATWRSASSNTSACQSCGHVAAIGSCSSTTGSSALSFTQFASSSSPTHPLLGSDDRSASNCCSSSSSTGGGTDCANSSNGCHSPTSTTKRSSRHISRSAGNSPPIRWPGVPTSSAALHLPHASSWHPGSCSSWHRGVCTSLTTTHHLHTPASSALYSTSSSSSSHHSSASTSNHSSSHDNAHSSSSSTPSSSSPTSSSSSNPSSANSTPSSSSRCASTPSTPSTSSTPGSQGVPRGASVRPREAAKFAELAAHWWDTEAGPFALLHALNPARVKFIVDSVCDSRGRQQAAAGVAGPGGEQQQQQGGGAQGNAHARWSQQQQQQQQQQPATSSLESEAATMHPPAAAVQAAATPQAAASEPLWGLEVLDVGCGGGLLCEPLARLGAHVMGVDLSQEGLGVAAGHAAADPLVAQRVRYQCTTAEQLAATGHSFDVVTASEVIEHVKKPGNFLQVLSSLCRPGGQVVVSTINRTPASYAVAILGAEYVTRMVPVGTHDWSSFLTPQELALLGEEAGLVLRHAAGMAPALSGRDFVTVSSLAVNYIVQFDKAG